MVQNLIYQMVLEASLWLEYTKIQSLDKALFLH